MSKTLSGILFTAGLSLLLAPAAPAMADSFPGARYSNVAQIENLVRPKLPSGSGWNDVTRFISTNGWAVSNSTYVSGRDTDTTEYISVDLMISGFIWGSAWYRLIFYFDSRRKLRKFLVLRQSNSL